jgi:hypothetical protein
MDLPFDGSVLPRVAAKYPQWPAFDVALRDGRLTGNYDINIIATELARPSPQKHRAWEAGFIRPFLLLVSLHPASRLAVAQSLDIGGLQDKIFYGSPHLEAWEILSAPKVGIMDRTRKFKDKAFADKLGGVCWYDTLFRVSDRVFSHKKDPQDLKEKIADYQEYLATIGRSQIQLSCRDATQAQLVEEFEATFVLSTLQKGLAFRETIGKGVTKLPTVFTSVDAIQRASATSKRIAENFEIAGYDLQRPDNQGCLVGFANFFFGHRWMRDQVDEGSNALFFEKEKQDSLRSILRSQTGYGWLLTATFMLTIQRLILAAVGVPLGAFYPSDQKTL